MKWLRELDFYDVLVLVGLLIGVSVAVGMAVVVGSTMWLEVRCMMEPESRRCVVLHQRAIELKAAEVHK